MRISLRDGRGWRLFAFEFPRLLMPPSSEDISKSDVRAVPSSL